MWIMTADGWRQVPWIGDEPKGVYRPLPIDQAIAENALRVDGYARNVQHYINDEISLDEVYRCWDEPVRGAFGEVLR